MAMPYELSGPSDLDSIDKNDRTTSMGTPRTDVADMTELMHGSWSLLSHGYVR